MKERKKKGGWKEGIKLLFIVYLAHAVRSPRGVDLRG